MIPVLLTAEDIELLTSKIRVCRRIKWRFGLYQYGNTIEFRIGKLGFWLEKTR